MQLMLVMVLFGMMSLAGGSPLTQISWLQKVLIMQMITLELVVLRASITVDFSSKSFMVKI